MGLLEGSFVFGFVGGGKLLGLGLVMFAENLGDLGLALDGFGGAGVPVAGFSAHLREEGFELGGELFADGLMGGVGDEVILLFPIDTLSLFVELIEAVVLGEVVFVELEVAFADGALVAAFVTIRKMPEEGVTGFAVSLKNVCVLI